MHTHDCPADMLSSAHDAAQPADDLLTPLLQGSAALSLTASAVVPHAPATPLAPGTGVVIGTLLALADGGVQPLVSWPGQSGSAAVRARTVVDLHGAHIGHEVVLMFEAGCGERPIVIGVLRGGAADAAWPLATQPGTVQVDVDGQRMVVSAQEQLVLRCGQASITLRHNGQVVIEGTDVLSRSTGVNRVKGGSVQLN